MAGNAERRKRRERQKPRKIGPRNHARKRANYLQRKKRQPQDRGGIRKEMGSPRWGTERHYRPAPREIGSEIGLHRQSYLFYLKGEMRRRKTDECMWTGLEKRLTARERQKIQIPNGRLARGSKEKERKGGCQSGRCIKKNAKKKSNSLSRKKEQDGQQRHAIKKCINPTIRRGGKGIGQGGKESNEEENIQKKARKYDRDLRGMGKKKKGGSNYSGESSAERQGKNL